MLTELDKIKDEVPEFVIKLYHILEKPEYQNYITWANQNTEVLIKQPKRIEDRVLPYFFRHKHLSSFIRQLNMYKFTKVNKISKERGWMYFKNQNFQRDNINNMKLIKRGYNSKIKERKMDSDKQVEEEVNQREKILLEKANKYKQQTQNKFVEIQNILEGVVGRNQLLQKELGPALMICQEMTGRPVIKIEEGLEMGKIENEANQVQKINFNSFLGNTIRQFVPMQSIIFPSICSFSHLQ